MNRSIVVTRYARALVKYVAETGQGAIVYSEADVLVRALHDVPDLKRMIEAADDVISPFEKKKLLQSALGNHISNSLSRFLTLLNQKDRMDLVGDILRDYMDLYERSAGVRKVHLTVVQEPSEMQLQQIRNLVIQQTGDDAAIVVTVDPDIIGGFVLDMDDYLLDASVQHQLDLIREQFVEQNRRII